MSSDPPGTVHLFAENGELLQTHVELIPKPSHDPEDPLNWSRLRKSVLLGCLTVYTLSIAITATSLYSAFEPISVSTGLTFDQLNVGTGYSYLAIGLAAIVTQPCTLAFGKRPVLLLSALSGGLINIWTIYASTNATWIISRLLLGFSGGPGFFLVETVIADVYFYHERALPLGIYVFVLYVGALIGPLLSGYINEGMGWKAIVWWSSGLSLLVALFLVFLLEETNFTRDEPSVAPPDPSSQVNSSDKDTQQVEVEAVREISAWPGPRLSRFFTVSPYASGILWRGMVQPFALMRLPIVLWCGFMYGIYQVFFNLFGSLSAGILAFPPYNFSSSSVGLTFLGPMLGTVPSAIWGGYLINTFAIRQARRNDGIAEPEHKLKLFLIPGILLPIGLLMMSLGPYYGAHWIVYVLGELINNLAGPLATLLVITYAFDSFHSIDPTDSSGPRGPAQDCAPYIVAIIFLGMVVTFAFSYAITPWSLLWSLKLFGITVAIISVVVNATSVVVLKWGRTARINGERYYRKVIDW